MNILVSACLVGVECRYSATDCASAGVIHLSKHYNLIPVCPEQLGGLMTPRSPAEIRNGRVINREGEDVTQYFLKGAEETLKIAELSLCKFAVLKEKSPSCGGGLVYDGSFTGTLTEGYGITAALLKEKGITVCSETELEQMKRDLRKYQKNPNKI